MNRTALLIVVCVVVFLAAVVPFVVMAQDDVSDDDDLLPGEQAMAAVGVGDAELTGEVEERAFGIAVAQSATDDAAASTVADQFERNEERLEEIEDRLATLNELLDDGEIGHGQYRAEVARLEAERASIERLSADAAVVADGLPTAVLEANGVNVTAIEALQARAGELGGEEVREIARSIAGERTPGDRPAIGDRLAGQIRASVDMEDVTDDAEETVDLAEAWIERTEQRVDRISAAVDTSADDDAREAINRATTSLELAEEHLAAANAALDAGDEARANELASEAIEHTADAMDAIGDLQRQVVDPPGGDPPIGPPDDR